MTEAARSSGTCETVLGLGQSPTCRGDVWLVPFDAGHMIPACRKCCDHFGAAARVRHQQAAGSLTLGLKDQAGEIFAQSKWLDRGMVVALSFFAVGLGTVKEPRSTAFIVVALAVPLGGLVAYGLVRGRFPGKGLLSSFLILPLIVPSTLTALALFYFYSLNMRVLIGTVLGIALPHAVLALPFVVIILAATMRGVDEVHEQAAMSLGAGRVTVFRRIIFPQIIPGIVVAAFFAFLVSFYEVVVAIFLKDPYLRTLPINLWNGVAVDFAPMMAAVSTLLLIFAIFIIVGLTFFRKKLNRGT